MRTVYHLGYWPFPTWPMTPLTSNFRMKGSQVKVLWILPIHEITHKITLQSNMYLTNDLLFICANFTYKYIFCHISQSFFLITTEEFRLQLVLKHTSLSCGLKLFFFFLKCKAQCLWAHTSLPVSESQVVGKTHRL